MVKPRVMMLAGATLCAALSIGLSMQPQVLFQILEKTLPSTSTSVAAAQDPSPLPDDPEVPLVLENITLTAAPHVVEVAPEASRDVLPTCEITLDTQPSVNAMVELAMSAPCSSNQGVTVHHSGMIFKIALDVEGRATVVLPALKERAVFLVETSDGHSASAVETIADFSAFDRVVLQWGGTGGFELHAREFGASYGETGHVWSGAASNGAGAVYLLGDASLHSPLMAEVYSLPKGITASGPVELTVEAEITDLNCDQTLAAQTLDLRDGTLRSRDLVLNMPSCDANGDFLVLNNLVENLTIAAN
ncbi:hypothetical protein GFB49_07345 [Epibacterium sp. SM1979]|uniref:Translocase n=1 Tax=Tritonibacter litoralis TaxID=2662264 RepID=A0A843YG47_9RHOB|nr:hypothetical protein [Tritonibacter litoralis]MQQ08262.1 hypothetical protein [Tritonibacter litoralis]